MQTKFKVIVPVYNAENWIGKCIQSIQSQIYSDWEVVIIDDSSKDRTIEEIKKAILSNPDCKSKFKVLKRTLNVGALENIVYGISKICKDDNEVIVLLDGDDWLASNEVFNILNQVYQEDNIWLTYGQFQYKSSGQIGTSRPIMNTENYRQEVFCSSHLRTFKYKIWKKINNNDLLQTNGYYYSMAWDMAIMLPLIEMCGKDRIKFIEQILYIYNDENPINDHKKNPLAQMTMDLEIRNKKPYQRL